MMLRKSILFLLIISLCGCATYNPATGRSELIFISTDQEIAMGVQAAQELSANQKVIEGTQEARRLESIGQRLVRVSDRQDYQYHFLLVDSPDMNAFTIPGGYIYFYTGLFRKLKTDDQIASVLAHEIGHCSAKHVVKRFQAALGYNLAGSVLDKFVAAKAPAAQAIVAMGANSIAQLAMSAYGRGDEHQADLLGLKYLHLAGYDKNAMIEAFEILEANTKSEHTPLILRTHPYIKDRIAAIRKEIEEKKY